MNSLKQISLAAFQHHDLYGKFPPGWVQVPFTVPQGRILDGGHGFFAFLLPFLEEGSLARVYDWEKRCQGPENQPVATAQLRILQCPAAAPDRWVTVVEDPSNYAYGGKGACTDYTAVREVDTSLAALGLVDVAANYKGVITRDHLTRRAEITDGTSHTMLVTECAGRPELWRAGRSVPGIYAAGGVWVSGTLAFGQGSTPDGALKPGPCAINCTNDREVFSFHAGGANATYADGSAHFLNADLDIRIFGRLVTRAGGEVATVR